MHSTTLITFHRTLIEIWRGCVLVARSGTCNNYNLSKKKHSRDLGKYLLHQSVLFLSIVCSYLRNYLSDVASCFNNSGSEAVGKAVLRRNSPFKRRNDFNNEEPHLTACNCTGCMRCLLRIWGLQMVDKMLSVADWISMRQSFFTVWSIIETQV